MGGMGRGRPGYNSKGWREPARGREVLRRGEAAAVATRTRGALAAVEVWACRSGGALAEESTRRMETRWQRRAR